MLRFLLISNLAGYFSQFIRCKEGNKKKSLHLYLGLRWNLLGISDGLQKSMQVIHDTTLLGRCLIGPKSTTMTLVVSVNEHRSDTSLMADSHGHIVATHDKGDVDLLPII